MTPRSAAYRIAAISGLILVAAAVVIGGLMLLVVHVRLSQSLDAQISAESDRFVTIWRKGGRPTFLAEVRKEESNRRSTLAHAVFDARGHRLAGDLDIARPKTGWSDAALYDPIEGNDPARVLARDMPDGELLAVASGSRSVEQVNELIVWQFVSSILVVALLSAMMAFLLGRYLQGRLLRISSTADAIVSDDLSRRIALSGTDDEFDRIAASLNSMLDRIALLVSGIRRVSSDVAHDLKTPLARLRARTEQALIRHPEATVHREALEHALEQIDEVLRLFDAMLRIAEIEEGESGPRCERFALAELVDDITQPLIPVFEAEERGLTIQVDPQAVPCGDRELLGMALINLLENVLRHTPAGTDALVSGRATDTGVEIIVSDRGEGMPEAELERIFTRFYCSDEARSKGGHGLGLSLVAAVAKAHNGRVTATNKFPGLTVMLSLPERCS